MNPMQSPNTGVGGKDHGHRTKPRFKVDGRGREWNVWQWGVRGQFWDIVAGPFLTRRRPSR